MFNKLRNTVKHTLIYSLGNLSSKLIGLVLLPLYTSHLTTEEYGTLAILETTAMFLVAVFGARLYVAMMRWWADAKTDSRRKSIVFTTFISLLSVGVLINIVFQGFNKEFSLLFFNAKEFDVYFKILFYSIALEIINTVAFSLLRLLERSKIFIFISISKLILVLILNIYFIIELKLGVKGIILSQLIGHLFAFIATTPFLLKNINFVFNAKVFSQMFKYSYPLIFTAISSLTITLSDRYFLKMFFGYSQLGIYSLAIKLAGLINVFIIQSFQMGFLPIAFKIYKQQDAKRFFSKILTYFTGVLIVSALALSFFSKEVIMLFSPENKDYWQAYIYVPLICFVFVLKGIEYVFIIGLHITKKTKVNFYIVLVAALLNVLLNVFLIPKFEITGAIISSLITGIFTLIMFYYFSSKHYKVEYEIVKIFKMLIVAFIIFFIPNLLLEINIILLIIIKLLLLLSFPFILYFLNFFEEIELIRIKQAWTKWRNPINWRSNLSSKEKQN